MGKTSKSTWTAKERRAARLFGAERQPLSGSAGRDDRSRSDSTHGKLYIESKLKAKTAVRSLWEDTALKAKSEHKTPVLALYDKGKAGGLFVVHERDLGMFCREYALAWCRANGFGLTDEDVERAARSVLREAGIDPGRSDSEGVADDLG